MRYGRLGRRGRPRGGLFAGTTGKQAKECNGGKEPRLAITNEDLIPFMLSSSSCQVFDLFPLKFETTVDVVIARYRWSVMNAFEIVVPDE